MACGNLWDARKRLRSALRTDRWVGPPVFQRMVYSRLFLLEQLLGRERAAEGSRRLLEAVPRTELLLLEAWNDLFAGLGLLWEKRPEPRTSAGLLERAGAAFRRLEIPSGRRLASIGLLHQALGGGDTQQVRTLLKELESAGDSPHKLLSVLEPLARGEASLSLGELDRAESCLGEAAAAIVGLSCLELDARMEYLRACLAERRGDREGGRQHLHRSLYTLDLLARSLPRRLREPFLRQPRFQPFAELTARLERPRTPGVPAELTWRAGCFQGMIGRSAAMLRLFRTIQQLADQDLPVLIVGETGTGKELVANAIHRTGPRRDGPFQALHCATLPAELLESELFGH
ncbi:MAG: sigma 54-interacting transcriptional regulator, partial [Thermoanaerobaculia bacterium]